MLDIQTGRLCSLLFSSLFPYSTPPIPCSIYYYSVQIVVFLHFLFHSYFLFLSLSYSLACCCFLLHLFLFFTKKCFCSSFESTLCIHFDIDCDILHWMSTWQPWLAGHVNHAYSSIIVHLNLYHHLLLPWCHDCELISHIMPSEVQNFTSPLRGTLGFH